LQEMRVTQTGTQILSGFLLTIAFQPTYLHLFWGASGVVGVFDRALCFGGGVVSVSGWAGQGARRARGAAP